MIYLLLAAFVAVFVLVRAYPEQLKEILCRNAVTGEVCSIEECRQTKFMQYYRLSYFYPKVEVRVTVNGHSRVCSYSGKGRAVSEVDSLGEARGDESFPWRNYQVGDDLVVRYCRWFPGLSYPDFSGK